MDAFFDLAVSLENLEDCIGIEIILVLCNELSEFTFEDLELFLLVFNLSFDLLWSWFLALLGSFLLI